MTSTQESGRCRDRHLASYRSGADAESGPQVLCFAATTTATPQRRSDQVASVGRRFAARQGVDGSACQFHTPGEGWVQSPLGCLLLPPTSSLRSLTPPKGESVQKRIITPPFWGSQSAGGVWWRALDNSTLWGESNAGGVWWGALAWWWAQLFNHTTFGSLGALATIASRSPSPSTSPNATPRLAAVPNV